MNKRFRLFSMPMHDISAAFAGALRLDLPAGSSISLILSHQDGKIALFVDNDAFDENKLPPRKWFAHIEELERRYVDGVTVLSIPAAVSAES